MIPSDMSRLDLVEVVMAIEESLGIEIPDVDAVTLGDPRQIVDWLALRLAGKHIDQQPALVLENLARRHGTPEIAVGLDGTWRRYQIAALVREILRTHALGDWSDPSDSDPSVRAPLSPGPRPRSGAAKVSPNEQQ
jgi:hypothetical protein